MNPWRLQRSNKTSDKTICFEKWGGQLDDTCQLNLYDAEEVECSEVQTLGQERSGPSKAARLQISAKRVWSYGELERINTSEKVRVKWYLEHTEYAYTV